MCSLSHPAAAIPATHTATTTHRSIWAFRGWKFPSDAPSRSTLKLEEAFHVFIPADEWDERLANGMYAVDLGACPGGWTYQLVKRNMWVSSVDNGPMAQSLMDTGG